MTLSYQTDYFIYHEAFDTPQVKSDTHFHEMVEVYYLLEGVACLYANDRLYRLVPGPKRSFLVAGLRYSEMS